MSSFSPRTKSLSPLGSDEFRIEFEDDVLPKKPNVVVLTFGMNDTGYMEYNQAGAEEFAKKKGHKFELTNEWTSSFIIIKEVY